MNWRHIGILIRYDLSYSLRSAKSLLFLVFYGLLWFWILWKLSEGAAAWLAQPDGTVIASWFFDIELATSLFQQHSPTLSVFFLLVLGVTPFFAFWSACDQTAGDIATRHLRYLMPRCGRHELFWARFLSASLFFIAAQCIIVVSAIMIALYVDNRESSEVIGYGLRIWLVVVAYSLPFVALMALLSALTASAGLAVLVAICIHALVTVLVLLIKLRTPQFEGLEYLMPTALRDYFISLDDRLWITGLVLLSIYLIVYLLAGWAVFRRRDI